ncbi:MAG: hypothetical protein H6609_16485 [Ignavibacteriales bacterium]|nr:hypothetical protein [Ignavibacteriales bacterium]
MGWINDVKHELSQVDISKKSLRKFGITIGIIFILLASWFIYRNNFFIIRNIFLLIGSILLIFGLLKPQSLKNIYKIWMGLAFALGWVVSRIILSILFFFVLAPIGLLAKIFGAKFLDLDFKNRKNSYWVSAKNGNKNLEKMY